jgi:hypothetical protein
VNVELLNIGEDFPLKTLQFFIDRCASRPGKTLGIDGREVIGKQRMLKVASGFGKHYK